jgi:hypothetical protein
MPRNGSGVQSSPGASYPAVASTLIESTKFNNVIDDINAQITNSIAADGQTTITGDLVFSSKKLTGLTTGSARTDSISLGQEQDGKTNWVAGGGTADAITASYVPALTALVDGQLCFVRATAANATTTPTFSPSGLTARTIVKKGGVALVAGDIEGAGHELILRYLLASTRWELLNPASGSFTGPISGTTATLSGSASATQYTSTIATGTAPFVVSSTTEVANLTAATATTATTANALANTASGKLPTISCTQATGALTFTASSQYLDFRSTTLTSGTPTTVLAAPANLVLPSGGTLGTVTTVQARLVLVELNNAGTAELAIVNIAGGNDLSETGLINTTAIDTASDSSNVFYSTTARTGVAYKVVGVVDAVNTAGAWDNPVLVQGAGGNALTAMGSLGYGQTWQDVTGSRVTNTTYYNTTGRPIYVSVRTTAGVSITNNLYVNNVVVFSASNAADSTVAHTASAIVPPGSNYRQTHTGSIASWFELR